MAINPVSASNAAVNSTQAVRPSRESEQAERVNGVNDEAAASQQAVNQVQQPKPTINGTGQTVGTLINITA